MSTVTMSVPTDINEFAVQLPDAELRKIDFSALSYQRAIRAITEYVKTYYPDRFNDFVASNGFVVWMELVANEVGKLSLRQDIIAGESFLVTARSDRAVDNHIALIGQTRRRQTSATVNIEVSLNNVTNNDVRIPAGTSFTIIGADRDNVTYEIFRVPGDFVNDIIIPSGKRGIIAYGIEGRFAAPFSYVSPGGPNQIISINEPAMLEQPIFVSVKTGDQTEDWQVVNKPIELYSPNDKVVEVYFTGDIAYFKFGDNVHGQALSTGQTVTIRYRVGGGSRGRISTGKIDEVRPVSPSNVSAAVSLRFRNIGPSSGGIDKETAQEAKKRVPKTFAMHGNIVTDQDYINAAAFFSHPYYGTILRASYAIRSHLNGNTIILYVLASGPDGSPSIANPALKQALQTYLKQYNTMEEVEISDGALKAVDVSVIIGADRNFDASVIQDNVEAAINNFFDLSNWSMGQPLYISHLYQTIQNVDGVQHVELLSPNTNFVKAIPNAEGTEGTAGANGGFSVYPYELIVLGTKKVVVYYDQR